MDQNKFKACAPPHCNCPEIEIIEGSRIIIKDDFKGEVTMTCAEFDMIIDWYKNNPDALISEDVFDDIVPVAPQLPPARNLGCL